MNRDIGLAMIVVVFGVPNLLVYWRAYSPEKVYMRRYCATYHVPEPRVSQWFFSNPFEAWDRLSIRQVVPELERMRRTAKAWLVASLVAPLLAVIGMLAVVSVVRP